MMRRKQEKAADSRSECTFIDPLLTIAHTSTRTKKRKTISDEEKLERRKRLKEESELPAPMAEAAN